MNLNPRKASTHASKVGQVRLVRNTRTGTLLYAQKGGNQTATDAEGISLDSYIHALHGLVLQTKPKTALMIGCAGGTLATMLTRAGVRMTVVDIDKAAFTLAKKHFGMPKSVKCYTADGLKFMQRTKAKFDAVIIDAFVGEKIPPQFKDDTFCAAARCCVRKTGALFVNVCLDGRKDRTADELGLTLRRNKWRVRLIDQRGPFRNAIVMADHRAKPVVRKLKKPTLMAPPALDRKRIAYELRVMRFRPIKAK
ncbi:MAG: methyltransferase domain-containing protein [Rhodospirillaceae bacterium]|nr:methyltransferase domain-containing protein [Rhodospirillaceae bacterium]